MLTPHLLIWLFAIFPVFIHGKKVIDLSSLHWTLSEPSSDISIPGKVPSQAHLDLLAAGRIEDPLYGKNDEKYLWVATTNWTYESGPIKGLNRGDDVKTAVVFDGIDTFANITVCKKRIGSTNNQFRQWTFDISHAVKACKGEVTMKLDFESARSAANKAAKAANCSICLGNKVKFPNRQFIRKEQSDFGWDWGPVMLPQGIWKPASIVQHSQASKEIYAKNSMIDIYRKGQLNNLPPDQSQPWVLNISIAYIGPQPSKPKMRVRLTEYGGKGFLESTIMNVHESPGFVSGSFVLNKKPKLWWPVGYGDQTLYDIDVELVDGSAASVAKFSKRTGFRTIVLNQTPFSKEEEAQNIYPGTKWLFEINGREMYMKGSNYVPQNSFWPSVTKEQVSKVFQTALLANQNMLRLWASGAYLPDFAYDLADEYGLLLWSEFEFGDAVYPTDDAFLENVAEEAQYQIRRLNHHPSLALWCGNNEIQLALGLFQGYKELYKPALEQFETLFMDLLLKAVFQTTRSISYLPSSENNGYISLNHSAEKPMIERYKTPPISKGVLYSNSDYYNYNVTQAFNSTAYPISRFSVEFGFISHSPVHTYAANMPKNDLWFNSSTIVHRNHHWPMDTIDQFLDNILYPIPKDTSNMSLAGIGQMSQAITLFYPTPPHGNKHALFPLQVYATQLFHAEFTRAQIEFYRRGSGLPERNMGSLYWQLNEIWAAPTWASVAVDGRWKALHYLAKDAYEPVIIAPYVTEAGRFSVSVTSDLWDSISGTASMTWYDWSGKKLENEAWSWKKQVHIGKINSTEIFDRSLHKLPVAFKHAVAFLEVNATAPGGRTFHSKRAFHPDLLSSRGAIAAMKDPKLRLKYDRARGVFVVTSEAIAAFVWLEHPAGVAGYWSENAFWMLPGRREVTFHADGELPTDWWADVSVVSLWDLTQGVK